MPNWVPPTEQRITNTVVSPIYRYLVKSSVRLCLNRHHKFCPKGFTAGFFPRLSTADRIANKWKSFFTEKRPHLLLTIYEARFSFSEQANAHKFILSCHTLSAPPPYNNKSPSVSLEIDCLTTSVTAGAGIKVPPIIMWNWTWLVTQGINRTQIFYVFFETHSSDLSQKWNWI